MSDRLLPPTWARDEETRNDLKLLHDRSKAARQAAQDVREESREIVARCLESRINRANQRGS